MTIQIKGSVLASRLALAERLAPGDGPRRVLARLSLDDQRTLEALLASSWYPFALGQRIDDALVQELGGGRSDFFEKLGEASAESNLGPTGVHRAFLASGDPHSFLERTPRIYGFYYSQGRREYKKIGEKEGLLTTYDAETFSVADCATVVGWHRRALAMCGARNPKVVEEECRARGGVVCRYRLSWA